MESTLEENKYWQISNKKNVRKIVFGGILILFTGVEVVVTVCVLKRNWMTKTVDAVSFLIIIVGSLMLFFGILGSIAVKKENEYLCNLPYRFDYLDEYEAHRNIGRKKKKEGFICFEKYSLWKSYIKKKYDDRKDNEDFYRFMNRKYRGKRSEKELMLNMMIPMDITLLTVFFTIKPVVNEMELVILLILMIGVLTVFLTINILNVNEEIYFIEDFMELVFPSLHKNTEHYSFKSTILKR